MTGVGRVILCAVAATACGATVVRAQAINGVAEWTVGRGSNASESAASGNSAFSQRYSVGIESFVLDPRLLRCTGEATFRTTSQVSGADLAGGEGRQTDVGYKFGMALFPRRAFPFFLDASRDVIGESGTVSSASGLRGSIVVPAGLPVPDVDTHTRTLNMGWQLNAPTLPRIEFGYRSSRSTASAGPYQAEQGSADLHGSVRWASGAAHHEARFQRTSFDNAVSAFNQRWSTIDYDFGTRFGERTSLSVHAGQHHTFSLVAPAPAAGGVSGAYAPPESGDSSTQVAVGTLSYQTATRVAIDATATVDRQEGGPFATSAALGTVTGRFDAGHGLTFSAAGGFGSRGQVVDDRPLTVQTKTAQVATSYRTGYRWIQAGASASRGIGVGTTAEGGSGTNDAWAAEGHGAISAHGVGLSVGYDRARSRDEVLAFGNYESERMRALGTAEARRVSVSASWDHGRAWRGTADAYGAVQQDSESIAVTYRVARNATASINGGAIASVGTFGDERNRYVGAAFDAQPTRRLHVLASLRVEDTLSRLANLVQRSLAGSAQVDYRLRLFTFGLDFRNTDQQLQYGSVLSPFRLRGHLFQVRITRRFGAVL